MGEYLRKVVQQGKQKRDQRKAEAAFALISCGFKHERTSQNKFAKKERCEMMCVWLVY